MDYSITNSGYSYVATFLFVNNSMHIVTVLIGTIVDLITQPEQVSFQVTFERNNISA